jgi:hypothetical protein
MSDDFTIPLDGKIALDAEPHRYRIPKPPAKPVAPRKAVKDAQALRHRALLAEGCVVKVGQLGTTVFRGAGSDSFSSFKVWDGYE